MASNEEFEYRIKDGKLVCVIDIDGMNDDDVNKIIKALKFATKYELRMFRIRRALESSEGKS